MAFAHNEYKSVDCYPSSSPYTEEASCNFEARFRIQRSFIMTSARNQPPTKEPAASPRAIHGAHHELRTAENSAGYLLGVLREKHRASPHLKLLDVGTRSGTISATLAQAIQPDGKVVATDSSSDVLQRAQAVAEEAGIATSSSSGPT